MEHGFADLRRPVLNRSRRRFVMPISGSRQWVRERRCTRDVAEDGRVLLFVGVGVRAADAWEIHGRGPSPTPYVQDLQQVRRGGSR